MKTDKQSEAEKLRQKAIEMLSRKKKKSDTKISEVEALKLIHELDVHQIELELQNEDLLIIKDQLETASKKYTELFDFAPLGYYIISKEGEIMEINFRGAEILGEDRMYLKNSRFGFFVSEETKPIFNLFLDKIFTGKTKDQSCEVILIPKRGFPFYAYLRGKVTESNEDECFVTALDITERKQAEIDLKEKNEIIEKQNKRFIQINEELAIQNEEKKKREEELIIAKEKAEESDRLKSSFLTNMSHEIRTPMNSIMGFAELLKKPMLSGKDKQEFIRIIEKGGARMLNMIKNIVDISKVESGQMEVSISKTNATEQLKQIYSQIKPEADEKGIELIISPNLPKKAVILKTDNEKLNTILNNLVKNAVKFTDTGFVEIGYKQKDKYLEFFVKDSGKGISAEKTEFIFEKFRQGDELHTSRYEGAGLGLSISKAYVEMLGGKIWVKSNPEKSGSTFYFTIPCNFEKE